MACGCTGDIPEVVNSDNGPQYSSGVYATFAREYQFNTLLAVPFIPREMGKLNMLYKPSKVFSRKREILIWPY